MPLGQVLDPGGTVASVFLLATAVLSRNEVSGLQAAPDKVDIPGLVEHIATSTAAEHHFPATVLLQSGLDISKRVVLPRVRDDPGGLKSVVGIQRPKEGGSALKVINHLQSRFMRVAIARRGKSVDACAVLVELVLPQSGVWSPKWFQTLASGPNRKTEPEVGPGELKLMILFIASLLYFRITRAERSHFRARQKGLTRMPANTDP